MNLRADLDTPSAHHLSQAVKSLEVACQMTRVALSEIDQIKPPQPDAQGNAKLGLLILTDAKDDLEQ